jgi:hypothetical protein
MCKWIIVVLTLVTGNVYANDMQYVEYKGVTGNINWSTGRVNADGYGVAPANKPAKVGGLLACRAAVVDAQRNLLEAIQGVRINSTTLISNYMLASDEVRTTMDGVVKNAALLSREPDDQGSCKVTMSAPLSGEASKAVYAQVLSQQKQGLSGFNWPNWQFSLFPKAYAAEIDTTKPSTWEETLSHLSQRISLLEQKISKSPVINDTNKRPTGLIVDARGSNFIPSMDPKIRELRGGVVYPNTEITRQHMNEGRLVSLFARELDFALSHPIVGPRPLLVKSLRTYGKTRTEIVLTSDYIKRITELDKQGFFANAGVIIILD